jgi:hypothetical protein
MMSIEEVEGLYERHIEELIRHTVITKSEIFRFTEGSPLDFELKRVFQFYYNALKKNIDHNLEPSFVFISNDRRLNAFASRDANGNNLIGINIGLIGHLFNFFKENDDLKSRLKRFIRFSAHELMFETAMHFTFYHELGHLIQKSSFLKNSLSESSKPTFSLKRHIIEFDADEFASILIAGHLASFTIDNLGQTLVSSDLEDLLVVVCTSILFYLLSFNSAKLELYYEEYSHPHPTIRIINIIYVVINHYTSTLKTYGVNAEIERDKTVLDTMKLGEQISNELNMKNQLQLMRESIRINIDEIDEYLTFLQTQKRGDRTMSIFKWNQYAAAELKSKGS